MPLWEQVSLLHNSNQYEALASKPMQSAINFELNKIIPLFVLHVFHGMGHNVQKNEN